MKQETTKLLELEVPDSYVNASRIPPGLDKLLAEQHYCILFYMSLLVVFGMVGIVDLISFVGLVCVLV